MENEIDRTQDNTVYYITNEPPDKMVMQELIPENNMTFTFILNYCIPPECFGELSRYRHELDFAAGRKGIFTGNVIIDLSQWINDADSPYLDAFLAYLFDHGENLRYIFVTSSHSGIEGTMYRRLNEYFPVESKEIDMYSEEFLDRHFRTVFGEKVSDRLARNAYNKLLKILSASASQYDLTLHMLETICEKLFKSINGNITSRDIDRFVNSDQFTKLCNSKQRPFGITRTDERG